MKVDTTIRSILREETGTRCTLAPEKLVSILIPSYNTEKWVAHAIRSAIGQTHPWKEIIFVDDGSRDRTLEIARSFQSKTLKILTQKNAGAAAARNLALRNAQGDYIQWLDADDLLAPDKIQRQVRAAEERGDGRALYSSSFGQFHLKSEKAHFQPTFLWQNLSPVEWLTGKFSRNIWMNPAVWLVSRELSDLAGAWDERLTLDDDGEYFSRVVSASHCVLFVPEAQSYYRQWNTRSLSRSMSEQACASLLLSLSLSFQNLLKLEDSETTRCACRSYLQIWYHYFYPEKRGLLEKIERMAHELGGCLAVPDLGWKYRAVQRVFGWGAAKRLMATVSRVKLAGSISWERLFGRRLGAALGGNR